ncbi:conserved exported hypothetical protein [Frankia canadensis]|uniref:DUF732 domain-containing protein n=1 Tax=Frankia canadensis TaxID=1836972 RepID=A0A2I2KNM9_9ACTN|nr:hypothetical protein [Frankia canadensis]SNQ47275.1 conserved exported hypothetical protein [Frankia canadensis]SOU54565.1 conserved exported hypothetical protein [Frankia canadensis]
MTKWRAPAVAVMLAAVLTACGGSGGSAGPASTSAAPAAAAATRTGAFDLVHDSEAAGAFATTFRTRFPALAGGQTDTVLRDDGAHICVDDLPAGGDQLALTRIPGRFARHGVTPDPATAAAILALARSTVCAAPTG